MGQAATTEPTSLRPFGERLAAAQFAIYRAEWQLEAEGDLNVVPALVQAILEFHGLCQSPELTSALQNADPDHFLTHELKRLQAHTVDIPLDLQQQAVGAALQSLQAWHAARATGDYGQVAGPFAQLVGVQRALGAAKARRLSELYGREISPYEALIDQHDPGRRLDFVRQEFLRMVPVCQNLLNLHDGDAVPTDLFAGRDYAMDAQHALALEVMTAMGYDANPPRGRLGLSAHPFCRRVGENEVWLTMRGEASPLGALITVIHEGAHGRYYQGLGRAFGGSWLGMVAGESLNEGMALLGEHIIARRESFARYLAPRLNRAFDLELSVDTIHGDLVQVSRDKLRTQSREVAYPLHLVLRMEIEEGLINGGLDPLDLPVVWNKRSHELLGVPVENDNEGCLQDIQMFAGYIGYFPSYLLGHMAAAQLFPAIEAALPELDDQMAEGDFADLNGWLHDHIYSAGRTQPVDGLIERVTGRAFSADALIDHLNKRYGAR